MLKDELQGILQALRSVEHQHRAIHTHMTHEEPRIDLLHFWAKGPAEDLARSLIRPRHAKGEELNRSGISGSSILRKAGAMARPGPTRFAPEV